MEMIVVIAIIRKYKLPVLVLLVLLSSVQLLSARVVRRYDPALQRQDLLLVGLGELTFHALSIRGNKQAFESGNPWLKESFATNYRASLFANGNLTSKFFINGSTVIDSRLDDEYQTFDPSVFRLRMSAKSTEPLWDSWRFTGEGTYDPNRLWEFGNLDTRLLTHPQETARLELLARLESDEYGYIEGGSLQTGFKDTKFSMRQRSLFGLFADIETGRVGAEVVAGKLEGETFREGAVFGIRANGTSGPYDLSNLPVIRGSEEVKIEVRDRFDESAMLSSRTLVRDIDYNIDYVRGRILLNQPVASETVSSDPIYIAITYDYQRSVNDDVAGSRISVKPHKNIRTGLTYMHRFRDERAVGIGENEPEDLHAADIAMDFQGLGSGYMEIARADNEESNEDHQALRAGWQIRVFEKLKLKTDFQRIDDQYRSFTKTDLNPAKNQQRLNFEGSYDLTARQEIRAFFGSLRGLEPNGQYNPYPGRCDEKVYRFGYGNRLTDDIDLDLRLERRDVKDRDDPFSEGNRRQRLVIDFAGKRDDFNFLRSFGYGVHYELITFRNNLFFVSDNTNTNQVAVSLSSRQSEGTHVELTQKFRLRDNRDTKVFEEREDATFVTMRVQPLSNLSSLATMEYKRITVPECTLHLWQDDPIRRDRAGTVALEYLPVEKVKALGKMGRWEVKHWYADSTTRFTNDFLMGQFTYYRSMHLSFNAESEYRRTIRTGTGFSRDRIWDLGLRINWNQDRFNEFTAGLIRRWQVCDNPPTTRISSSSYIVLASGAISLGRGFFTRGKVKAILLRDALDDEKTFSQVEIGYEDRYWYRVSIGYERIENNTDIYPDRYYRGEGIFFRLTGKI